MFENTPPKDDIVNHLQNLQLDPTIFQIELDDNNCNSYTEYYSDDQLTSLHKESQNNVSMLNANIRSLGKNFDSFKDVITLTLLRGWWGRCGRKKEGRVEKKARAARPPGPGLEPGRFPRCTSGGLFRQASLSVPACFGDSFCKIL